MFMVLVLEIISLHINMYKFYYIYLHIYYRYKIITLYTLYKIISVNYSLIKLGGKEN